MRGSGLATIAVRFSRLVVPDRVLTPAGWMYAPKSIVPTGIAAALLVGRYEEQERRLVRRCLPPDQDVVEIGAGIGFISRVIARTLVGSRAHVVVEANPALLPVLRRNLEMEKRVGRHRVVHGAVTADGGNCARLNFGPSGFHSSSLRRSSRAGTTVPRLALDDVTASVEDGYTLIMDVEGAEDSLLVFKDSLRRCGMLILELHPQLMQNTSWYELLDGLGRSGFDFVSAEGSVLVLRRTRRPSQVD